MAKAKKKPEKVANDLEGWSQVIRDSSKDSMEKEQWRRDQAQKLLADLRAQTLPWGTLVKALLKAFDDGEIRVDELISELRLATAGE